MDVSRRMDPLRETTDHLGQIVRVGTRVKVLALADDFLLSLPDDELEKVREMIGGVFEVDEVDEWGQAWVTKLWDVGDGDIDGHGVGLSPSGDVPASRPRP